ncbi:endo-1,3-beta-glucanase [Pseudovirgaria hyperparasitica]|uniref:glucan endo-1,3-beta-D-glucosidase n=1 Tax=Pseudovirgaria hyperparasitica TaxID=470096 RepID=A0A6A6VUR5_9PEZI|nr:endo-1,3-beta-glucanase [Pseudovirgaria hyperparasitica]KAF2753973.1 endo-1,3-beta-glucanase [Pseudovirgaria hyperparasitica]
MAENAGARNIFVPIDNNAPPRNIPREEYHPVPRKGVIRDSSEPIQTNKFYANLFLEEQQHTVWTHPYSIWWSKGNGNAKSWGLSISHIERNQLVVQPVSDRSSQNSPSRYFLNPTFIQSITLSAAELGPETRLTTDSHRAFSVNVNLQGSSECYWTRLQFPLTQGMGFVTGKYINATPLIQSGVFFRSFTGPALVDSASCKDYGATYRFITVLEDGNMWALYMTPSNQPYDPFSLRLRDNSTVAGNEHFSGLIQVAKISGGSQSPEALAVFDRSAGAYPQSADISGSVSENVGSYTFSWTKHGIQGKPLLMYALPHHVESMDVATLQAKTHIQLQTTTKGVATAFQADRLTFTMVESNLPTDMGFGPWGPVKRDVRSFAPHLTAQLSRYGQSELSQDMDRQSNLNSMYFSGKALAKFATIAYVTNDIAQNPDAARAGLAKLKAAFNTFVQNKQPLPLVYDLAWKGIVSSGGYEDKNLDFGNTYYNDHHFHYGYFVYAAAVIGYLDPDWLHQGTNKAWVQMLVKDFANSSTDSVLPFYRSFDWFCGHSWAKGLFESADGKDQESSSEDVFAAYALKMWGHVIGDRAMESRGNLMLSILSRTLDSYYLMRSNNTIHPPSFIPNKVVGIMFENKADCATYFGLRPEYIHGIHMLPLCPATAFTRRSEFAKEEFEAVFEGRLQDVGGGWLGIIMANVALFDPQRAYRFFADDAFKDEWLDDGASRTWYLCWCAALGGV